MLDYILSFFENRTFGAQRSSRWSEVRKGHIALYPNCAVCGKKGGLLKANEVHHKMPFHLDASLELNPQNLITLCRPDHLLFGHLNNFKSFNKDVEIDARIMNDKIKNRP